MAGGRKYVDKTTYGDGADEADIEADGSGTILVAENRTYPPSAADPTVPPPNSGDRYYNNVALEWRWYNGTIWVPYEGGSSAAPTFGAASVGSSPTVRYLYPGNSNTLAETTVWAWRAPFAGTISDLYIRHNTPVGNGNTITYTVRVNGVASPVSVGLASTGSNGSDTANSVVVAAGDRVDIEITKALGIGSSSVDVVATFKLS